MMGTSKRNFVDSNQIVCKFSGASFNFKIITITTIIIITKLSYEKFKSGRALKRSRLSLVELTSGAITYRGHTIELEVLVKKTENRGGINEHRRGINENQSNTSVAGITMLNMFTIISCPLERRK